MAADRLLAFLSLLLAAAGCASGRPSRIHSPGEGKSPAAPRYRVVESAHDCRTGEEDALLAEKVRRQRKDLVTAFGKLGAQLVFLENRRGAIAKALGEPERSPLVFIYVGHGVSSSGKSVLCLSDGQVPVDDLLAAIHPEVAHVVLVLDACESADVDVRKSPVPAAVLSASHRDTGSPTVDRTGLSEVLLSALEKLSADGDGPLDDEALAAALSDETGQPVLGRSPFLRLRRQAWCPLPVLAARRRELRPLCREPDAHWVFDASDPELVHPGPGAHSVIEPKQVGQLLSAGGEAFELRRMGGELALLRARTGEELASFPPEEAAEVVSRVERGSWARFNAGYLWHFGRVGDEVTTLEGRRFCGHQLVPIWCRGAAIGQCFRVRPGSRAEEPCR